MRRPTATRCSAALRRCSPSCRRRRTSCRSTSIATSLRLGMIVGSAVLFIAVSPKLGVSNLAGVRGAGEIEARPDRDRHQRRGHAAAFCRARDREKGRRADHRRALQPGWHHGGGRRHHGRARAWHDRGGIRSARPVAIRRPQADRPDGAAARARVSQRADGWRIGQRDRLHDIGCAGCDAAADPAPSGRRACGRRSIRRPSSSGMPISACRSGILRRSRPRLSSKDEQKIWWPLVREFTPPEARN